jgi:putative ABC transport system permease protein
MIFRYALRDLLRQWRFSLFFIINVSIGLAGFITLETFKNSLQDHLKSNAKEILAADLSVESRREFSKDELKKLEDNQLLTQSLADKTIIYDFFAMASVADKSKLVSVKAVEEKFPLYGSLDLKSGQKKLFLNKSTNSMGIPKAWVYAEVLEQFNVKVGDQIKLGKISFLIDDVIEKDSTQTFRSASMAPRLYIPLDSLKKTGLIQFGSTFSNELLFKFKPKVNINLIKESIYKDIIDPSVRVETPDSASEDAGRQLNYLSDYLGLVSLVSLFLSALGAAYLFRLYILEKLKDIAILQALGFKANQTIKIYLFETIVLGLSALLLSFIFSGATLPFLSHFLIKLIPFTLELKISFNVFISGLLISLFGSFCIGLPFLLSIRDVSVSQLFSEEHFQSQIKAPKWFTLIPALTLFILLSIYQSHSYKMGIGFCGGLAVILTIFTILGWLSLAFISIYKAKKWSIKYSLISLRRKKTGAITLFVSLALGTLLINILPQLKVTLQDSMTSHEGAKLPSLFMFDIQDDQIDSLKTYFAEKNISVLNFSPMIRSRILKVNDLEFERTEDNTQNRLRYRTREEDRDARFRNRGANLTYRNSLSDSETLTEGVPFSGKVNPDLAEVSVEYQYAERMGLKLGDLMIFDIQGIELKGRIVNLRSIKWTSFQPNFFIVIQPGFLEEAPKTFIGALPRMNQSAKSSLQRDLAQKFSNISIIDVDHLTEDILRIADQMSISLELMAWLSVIAGLLVLYSIVRTQVQARRWELNMLKILGAKKSDLKSYLLTEVLVVTFMAAVVGALISLVASSFLSHYIFGNILKMNLLWILSSIVSISLLSFAVAWLAAQKIMNESPSCILTEM